MNLIDSDKIPYIREFPFSTFRLQTCKLIITPHEQRERGKVIDRGVHIYIYMSVVKKKFESYFRDRLTILNVDSRTSR